MMVINIILGMALADAVISIIEKDKNKKIHRISMAIIYMVIAIFFKT